MGIKKVCKELTGVIDGLREQVKRLQETNRILAGQVDGELVINKKLEERLRDEQRKTASLRNQLERAESSGEALENMTRQYEVLKGRHNALSEEYDILRTEYQKLKNTHSKLKRDRAARNGVNSQPDRNVGAQISEIGGGSSNGPAAAQQPG